MLGVGFEKGHADGEQFLERLLDHGDDALSGLFGADRGGFQREVRATAQLIHSITKLIDDVAIKADWDLGLDIGPALIEGPEVPAHRQ